MSPLNGQDFIRYSGIWGSPGDWYATFGYWNPAYNETQKGADYFIDRGARGELAMFHVTNVIRSSPAAKSILCNAGLLEIR